MPPTTTAAPGRSRRPILLLAGLALAGAVAALAVWLLFFAGDPPAQASIDEAAGVVASASPTATSAASAEPTEDASASASAETTTEPTTAVADGVDGTWTVDPSVGSFSDYTSAWAGFRVNEVLGQGIGSTTAIGRTPDVSGELTIDGTTLSAATIEVDLTTITSDRTRRDDAIQRALETSGYPTATFVLTEPVDLGGVPADGETVTATATGDLTIHGTKQSVSFPLEAQLVGDTIVVVGSTEVTFSDYGVEMPTAPIVVSVEDRGILELQLFFTRSAAA